MKLTNSNVAEIKVGLAAGIRQASLAAEFGVSRSTVSDIATGRLHAKVPWPDGRPGPKMGGASGRSPTTIRRTSGSWSLRRRSCI